MKLPYCLNLSGGCGLSGVICLQTAHLWLSPMLSSAGRRLMVAATFPSLHWPLACADTYPHSLGHPALINSVYCRALSMELGILKWNKGPACVGGRARTGFICK